MLTLQRAGEVAGAHESDFSWTDELCIIPAERTKSVIKPRLAGATFLAGAISSLRNWRLGLAFAGGDQTRRCFLKEEHNANAPGQAA